MKKRVIIISISMIILLVVVISISYIITKNVNSENEQANNIQEDSLLNSEEKSNNELNKSEYRDINIDSRLANEIFEFVPKYLPNSIDKMSNEYMIYAAISKLEDEKETEVKYVIDNEELSGYKFDVVQKAARKIYGNDISLEKKSEYKLPMVYSSKEDVFFKKAMSVGSSEDFQVIKELKENDKTYKLTLYAVSVEYDINDLTNLYISTKETYKLYESQEMDNDVIRKSMKEYVLNETELDPTSIVNEYKNSLPLIEYELEKLDDRGTKYFLKDTKVIVD